MTPSENAKTYIGQMEVSGNAEFVDPAFSEEMKEEGWQYFWAWCAVFMKVVYKNAYPHLSTIFNKLFSPSAVQTCHNFRAAGWIMVDIPVMDGLVVWEKYKNGRATGKGHIGCISDVRGLEFTHISGNTNGAGSREGDRVAPKDSSATPEAWKVNDGMRLVGIIDIVGTIKLKQL